MCAYVFMYYYYHSNNNKNNWEYLVTKGPRDDSWYVRKIVNERYCISSVNNVTA